MWWVGSSQAVPAQCQSPPSFGRYPACGSARGKLEVHTVVVWDDSGEADGSPNAEQISVGITRSNTLYAHGLNSAFTTGETGFGDPLLGHGEDFSGLLR